MSIGIPPNLPPNIGQSGASTQSPTGRSDTIPAGPSVDDESSAAPALSKSALARLGARVSGSASVGTIDEATKLASAVREQILAQGGPAISAQAGQISTAAAQLLKD